MERRVPSSHVYAHRCSECGPDSARLPGVSATKPLALNQDGSVMVGFSGDPNIDLNVGPFIWTQQLGTANLDDFVKLMGGDLLCLSTLNSPNSMSADGT